MSDLMYNCRISGGCLERWTFFFHGFVFHKYLFKKYEEHGKKLSIPYPIYHCNILDIHF